MHFLDINPKSCEKAISYQIFAIFTTHSALCLDVDSRGLSYLNGTILLFP